jgi:hypothetical protein
MRGAKINQNDSAVAEAAHCVLAHILRLSPADGDSHLRHLELRVRKRYAVLLHAEELASELFYSGDRPHAKDFLPRILGPILVNDNEMDHAKLRERAWRLVVKHHETILPLALELTRVRRMSEKQLVGFLATGRRAKNPRRQSSIVELSKRAG